MYIYRTLIDFSFIYLFIYLFIYIFILFLCFNSSWVVPNQCLSPVLDAIDTLVHLVL